MIAAEMVSSPNENMELFLRNAGMSKYSKKFQRLGVISVKDLLTLFNDRDVDILVR
jgi:hypothetical protein